MRRKYIAGNWKMNLSAQEAVELATTIRDSVGGTDTKIMIAPVFTALSQVAEVTKGSNIILGAQNCAPELSGAHTGEVSVRMLKELGVQTVILGHSERRTLYGEKNVLINQKIRTALAEGLEIILCVGETLEERERDEVSQVVDKQLLGGLDGISSDLISHITIAYEPVWAIGTGKTATASDANQVHTMIRSRIGELYGSESAENIIIQYGGSVKPSNAQELLSQNNIDGALVGGASLEAQSFIDIVKSV